MKEHLKRRIELSKGVIPEKGSQAYEQMLIDHEKMLQENPELRKKLKDNFKKAVKTFELQLFNGIELGVDSEIRHFLDEFNHRSWNFGHRKLPMMFNIMESFFDLDKTINYWELQEEEDYSISFFDFIDYYTSYDFQFDASEIKENIVENLIYNYHINSDIKEITFKTNDGSEFVVAGISLIRRGNEVTFLFLTGEVTDTIVKTKKLGKLSASRIPGKEMISPAEDRIREAVPLNNDPNLWKTLIACRFDIESQTLDARYVAQDEGNSYAIISDDKSGLQRNGKWITENLEKVHKSQLIKIQDFASIFELAKICLYIPNYFNKFEDQIVEVDYPTELKNILSGPIKSKKYAFVDSKHKKRNRTLWSLNVSKNSEFDKIVLNENKFRIDSSGYWKELLPDEIGTDKKNRPINGRTWVQRVDSYYVDNNTPLIITNSKENIFDNKNSGWIYIMRNANFGKNIFKIGLTSKDTNTRAKQLSKTSVPDQYFVLREWAVRDCIIAEKRIHEKLNEFRIDQRREFFLLDMKVANDVIDVIINSINNNA